MLPQHQPDQDYCFLVSVIGVKPGQLHQMADSTNPSLVGHVIQWYYLCVIPKITGGFRVIALSLLPSLSTIVSISIKAIGLEFFLKF